MESTATAEARRDRAADAGPIDGARAARRLLEAIAARDYKEIFAALAPAVHFRYVIPSGPGEMTGAADVAARFLGWFGDADELEVKAMRVEPIADRTVASLRFLLHEHDRWEVIEQQMVIDVDEERRVVAIDLVCSGFRPSAAPEGERTTATHRYDAGDLGCADGLAQEFRRRILAIPIGDALVVQTTDPAAKEDLPPLARMMGHTIRSIESPGGGRLLITIERGR